MSQRSFSFTTVVLSAWVFASSAMAKMVTVLSIDGGGMRGIIPAMFLNALTKKTQMPIHRMFDYIVGTSTGGIIALGLAIPDEQGQAKFTPNDLVDLYEKNGSTIFQSSIFRRGIFMSRYHHGGLEGLLENKFGSAMLNQTLTNVAVTAYDIGKAEPLFMTTASARKNPEKNFYVKHAARATSAAPTYFEPAYVHGVEDVFQKNPYLLVDGGIIMNNPSLLAYVETHLESGDDILMVSLGTGEFRKSTSKDDLHGGGALFWATPILDHMMSGVSLVNDEIVGRILGNQATGKSWKSYYRMQIDIPEFLQDMDKTTASHISGLKAAGENMIQKYSKEIDEIALAIRSLKNFSPPTSQTLQPRSWRYADFVQEF